MFDADVSDSEVGEYWTRAAIVDPLYEHIAYLWQKLPSQSRQRLECLAVSAGTGTSRHNHTALVGALEMIAREEGAPESEFEFARTYLGTAWICKVVSEGAKRGRPASGIDPKVLAEARWGRFKERKAKSLEKKLKAQKYRRNARLAGRRNEPAIAIDGEGVTLDDGSHVYRYLAACTSDGTLLAELDCEYGIGTTAVLEFIAALPKRTDDGRRYAGVFGYGLGYDWTKWLEGMKDKQLYEITHQDDAEERGPVFHGRYGITIMGKCMEVLDKKRPKGFRQTKVWDIIRAFQSKFVDALEKWKIGAPADHARMRDMKNKRGNFVNEDWGAVKQYCRNECRFLAQLAESYMQAHIDADIDLRGQYHGAGSTGGAFLREVGAEHKLCRAQEEAATEYSRAFFGGRAEISRLGTVEGPFHSYDIASAYPHALHSFPCLVHGSWNLLGQRSSAAQVVGECTKRMVNNLDREICCSKLACVRYRIPASRSRGSERGVKELGLELLALQMKIGDSWPGDEAWGALPFRTEKGSIVFSESGPGGWIWTPEYKAARDGWNGVEAVEAWVMRSKGCACEAPYARIGEWYLQRIQWGAEGRGIVVKLGLNSMYGKTAQTVGKNPKYRCRVTAGMITSMTRARILEAIASAKDRWAVIYIATDGIISTEEIVPPEPADNSTKAGACNSGKAMLGAWEHTVSDGAFHMLQPGFYFSLTDKKKVKTRGTPADAIINQRQAIADQWRAEPLVAPKNLPKRSSFRGIKTSILPPSLNRKTYERKASYGRWEVEEHKAAYVSYPKRSVILAEAGYRMATWNIDKTIEISAEYSKDVISSEAKMLKAKEIKNDEQPDWQDESGHVGED